MKVLLIAYDLQDPGTEDDVIEKLEKHFDVWSRVTECAYAVETSMTPRQVYDLFRHILEPKDILYVLNLTRPFHGQGPLEVSEWLDDTLP